MPEEAGTRYLDVSLLLRAQLKKQRTEQAELKAKVKTEILPKIHENDELRQLNVEAMDNKQRFVYLRQRTEEVVRFELRNSGFEEQLGDKELFIKEILDEALGLGPLEDLLADPSVTEIMVNAHDRIFVERAGKLELTNRTFASVQRLYNVIERIVAPVGRRIDESSPYVDARLIRDGSRVHIIIPPLALSGPTVTIRKFSKEPLTYHDLIRWGAVTPQAFSFLNLCVRAKKSMAVSGGTGTGKTTLLNILSNSIPDDERIITIEDAAELRLSKINLVTLESRKPNVEGRGEVTIRDLVKNALRMRPDRIVVGECRGAEAFDMLQAMNTGHEGSLTTIHANTPKDMLVRLENLVLMAADIPVAVIRQNIASALDLIVQISRFRDGSRKISRISEVADMSEDGIQTKDIFVFEEKGLDEQGRVTGQLRPVGYVPSFMATLQERGFDVGSHLFDPGFTQEGLPAMEEVAGSVDRIEEGKPDNEPDGEYDTRGESLDATGQLTMTAGRVSEQESP